MFVEQGKRSEPIDMARGLGALLVIWGHSFTGPAQASVYLFHMPLFFFLSGLLFREKPWDKFLAARLKNLAVPTISFAAFVAIFAIFWSGLRHGEWGAFAAIKAAYSEGMFVVFWFAVALFLSETALNALRRFGRWGDVFVGVALATSYLASAAGVNTPLSLLAAVHSIALLRIGVLLRGWQLPGQLLWYSIAVALIALAVIFDPLVYNMKEEYFGIPLLSLAAALAVSIAILFLCRFLECVGPIAKGLAVLGSPYALALMFLQQPIQIALMDMGVVTDWMRFVLTSLLTISVATVLHTIPLLRAVFFGR